MSDNRRRPGRETVRALAGVSVIAIGLVVTLVLHLTHDPDRPAPVPRPAPITSVPPSAPGH